MTGHDRVGDPRSLQHNPKPSRDDIRTAISGNLCRCSGYVKVIEAIELRGRATCAARRRNAWAALPAE